MASQDALQHPPPSQRAALVSALRPAGLRRLCPRHHRRQRFRLVRGFLLYPQGPGRQLVCGKSASRPRPAHVLFLTPHVQAAVTTPALIYLIAATGPFQFKTLAWSQHAQLILEGMLFCLWMLASPTSDYNCTTVCRACMSEAAAQSKNPSSFFAWVGALTCSCQMQRIKGMQHLKHVARRVLRQARDRPGKGLDTTKIISTVSRMAQKKYLDYVMMSVRSGSCACFPLAYSSPAASLLSASVSPVSQSGASDAL